MENTQNETATLEAKQPETADLSLFTVGSVLSITWKTMLKNPVIFFGLTVLSFAFEMITEHGLRTIVPGIDEELYEYLQFCLSVPLTFWIIGAITYCVFQTLKVNSVSLEASLHYGMRHFVPLFCVGVLYSLAIGLSYVLAFNLRGREAQLVIFAVTIIMVCMWEAAVSACVVERLGAVKSLARSQKLTRGYRWQIFGLILIVWIPVWVIGEIVEYAIAPVEPVMLHNYQRLAAIVLYAFGYVMSAVIYHELRKAKEGVSVDSLTNVFD